MPGPVDDYQLIWPLVHWHLRNEGGSCPRRKKTGARFQFESSGQFIRVIGQQLRVVQGLPCNSSRVKAMKLLTAMLKDEHVSLIPDARDRSAEALLLGPKTLETSPPRGHGGDPASLMCVGTSSASK